MASRSWVRVVVLPTETLVSFPPAPTRNVKVPLLEATAVVVLSTNPWEAREWACANWLTVT